MQHAVVEAMEPGRHGHPPDSSPRRLRSQAAHPTGRRPPPDGPAIRVSPPELVASPGRGRVGGPVRTRLSAPARRHAHRALGRRSGAQASVGLGAEPAVKGPLPLATISPPLTLSRSGAGERSERETHRALRRCEAVPAWTAWGHPPCPSGRGASSTVSGEVLGTRGPPTPKAPDRVLVRSAVVEFGGRVASAAVNVFKYSPPLKRQQGA